MKRWRCTICNYIHEGDAPPERCPICNAPASKFVEIDSAPDKTESKKSKTPKTAPIAEPATGLDKIKDLTVKHHLHPISVHFPNGILPVVVVLFILALLSGNVTMAKAGFYNLVFVLLSLPVVLLAGVVAWQKKYRSALTKLFKIKIAAATVTAVLCLVAVVWFLLQPDVISSSAAWVFIALNVVMLSSAGVAGFIGGKLVFKD